MVVKCFSAFAFLGSSFCQPPGLTHSPICISGTPDYEPVCGRPHGVRMDQDGNVIVVDSYLGLYKVNPRTGEKTLLLSSEKGDATVSGEVN